MRLVEYFLGRETAIQVVEFAAFPWRAIFPRVVETGKDLLRQTELRATIVDLLVRASLLRH